MATGIRMGRVEKEIGTARDAMCFRVVTNVELCRSSQWGGLRGVTARAIYSAFTGVYFILLVNSKTYCQANRERIVEYMVAILSDEFRFQRSTFFSFTRRFCGHGLIFRVVRSSSVLVWSMRCVQYVVRLIIALFGKSVFGMFRNVRDNVAMRSACFLIFSQCVRAIGRTIGNVFCYRNFYRQLFFTNVIQVNDDSGIIISACTYR